MKNIILLLILSILLISIAYASNIEVCEYEQDPFSLCKIVTPAGMSCTTYNLYNPNNSTNISNAEMGVLNANAGIYSVTFNQSDPGGWIVQLCDNSTAQINIKTTDETDLTTILVNQATIEQEVLSIQTNITDQTDIIDSMINQSRDLENETREQIIVLINNLWDNSTIGAIFDDIKDTSATGLSARIWSYTTRALTNLLVGDDLIATQTNITDLNDTVSDIVINNTAIAIEVLFHTDLANKTITYNEPDDIDNMTTRYDDLGFEYTEEFIYNDTTQRFYLNSTKGRRIE